MCGIVGAIAQRDVVPLLVDGLKRLEYRGYDSAGIAVVVADKMCIRDSRWPGDGNEFAIGHVQIKRAQCVGFYQFGAIDLGDLMHV